MSSNEWSASSDHVIFIDEMITILNRDHFIIGNGRGSGKSFYDRELIGKYLSEFFPKDLQEDYELSSDQLQEWAIRVGCSQEDIEALRDLMASGVPFDWALGCAMKNPLPNRRVNE